MPNIRVFENINAAEVINDTLSIRSTASNPFLVGTANGGVNPSNLMDTVGGGTFYEVTDDFPSTSAHINDGDTTYAVSTLGAGGNSFSLTGFLDPNKTYTGSNFIVKVYVAFGYFGTEGVSENKMSIALGVPSINNYIVNDQPFPITDTYYESGLTEYMYLDGDINPTTSLPWTLSDLSNIVLFMTASGPSTAQLHITKAVVWIGGSTLEFNDVTVTDVPTVQALPKDPFNLSVSDSVTVTDAPQVRRTGTRFYLQSTRAAELLPGFNAAWNDTSAVVSLRAGRTARGTPMTTVNFTDANAANRDVLLRQYVSDELVAQTIIAQNLKLQIRALETLATNNLFVSIHARVVTSGGANRGNLITGVVRDNTEISETTLTGRSFVVAVSSVAGILAGDRIVFEIGVGGDPDPGSSHGSSISIGDDNTTDLPNDDSTTSAFNPWVQFDEDIFFLPTDLIFVTDVPTVYNVYPINVFDGVTVAETVTVSSILNINVNDSITVVDAPTVSSELRISIVEVILVEEGQTTREDSFVSVFDSVTIIDAPSLDVSISISVDDSVSVVENVNISSELRIDIVDIVLVEEGSVTREDANVDVFESVTVIDVATLESHLNISTGEDITIAEVFMVAPALMISVSDTVSVNEFIALSMNIFVFAFDNIPITEGQGSSGANLFVNISNVLSQTSVIIY